MDETTVEGAPGPSLVPAPHVSWREVGGEVILLDGDSGTYLNLNPVGAELWRLLSDGAPPQALTAQLVEGHGVDEVHAEADVGSFVSDLRSRGLVVPARGEG